MLQFLAHLSEMHVDPTISDPKNIDEIPDDARSENEGRPNWPKDDLGSTGLWTGIFKDVGIFTDYDWHSIMCKCLASMGWFLPEFPSLDKLIEGATIRNSTCGLGIPYNGPVCRQSGGLRDWSPSQASLADWLVRLSSFLTTGF